MSKRIGRNEPCPCGSGRKYKHCHGDGSARDPVAATTHEGAIARALEWLANRHAKALQRESMDLLLEDLWPEDGPHPEDVDPQAMSLMLANLDEWMLAEGQIEIRKHWHNINQMVLGEGGPAFNPAQREFIAQLGVCSLGLHTVTTVESGVGVTLLDALAEDPDPVFVNDVTLAQSTRPGQLIGCRILSVGGRNELSGALYPFTTLGQVAAIEAVRDHLAQEIPSEDRSYERGWAIMAEWLQQLLAPPEMPRMIDGATGDPLLFIIDHYRVVDQVALRAALEGCPLLQPDAEGGWTKAAPGADGVERLQMMIHPGKVAARLEVFYRTRRLADEGQIWFEALAGATVRHLSREIEDPLAALRQGLEPDAPQSGPGLPPELTPEEHTRLIDAATRRLHATWADERIPALGNRTPREASLTRDGLERVKMLLRTYAANEADRAAGEGREPVSYRFLWDVLNIEPDKG